MSKNAITMFTWAWTNKIHVVHLLPRFFSDYIPFLSLITMISPRKKYEKRNPWNAYALHVHAQTKVTKQVSYNLMQEMIASLYC